MPRDARGKPVQIPCDRVVMAIGQDIESEYFAACGLTLKWDMLQTDQCTAVPGFDGVFAGGDCAHGPSTVIKAIEAGKVAAASIDQYLGFERPISTNIDIPPAPPAAMGLCGRVTTSEREASERKTHFRLTEIAATRQEIKQECARCLRCDERGPGKLADGRVTQW
jgi:NADPH-dependent glutamate synthase beta subunit-like oxidoreductase